MFKLVLNNLKTSTLPNDILACAKILLLQNVDLWKFAEICCYFPLDASSFK